MKKIVFSISFVVLAIFGCSKMESSLVGPENSNVKVAYNNSDQVQVLVCKSDKSLWKIQGQGYEQQYQMIQGEAKCVSLAHASLFPFDPSLPPYFSNTGESWYIGGNVNNIGNPFRFILNSGWVSYPVSSALSQAADIAAHIGWRYSEHIAMITSMKSVNGNNVYKLNGTSWEPLYNSQITAKRIDIDWINTPWCVTPTGKVYRYTGQWERMDNGQFQANDIGCGFTDNGIYVTTSEGLVYNYVDGTWNPVTQFNNLNVFAVRISASCSTAIVSTENGDLYYIFNYGYGSYQAKKADITNVVDVSIQIIPAS